MAALLADIRLAAVIARRELRGGRASLIFFLACLMLGVAAIASVGLVNRSIVESVGRDARTLLGGDIELENPMQPIDAALLDQVRPAETRLARTVRVNSTAESGGRRAPIVIKAVDGNYPLYGAVTLSPSMPIQAAIAGDGAVAEPALLARLGIKVGDRFKVGDQLLVLTAVLDHEPDRLGGLISIGPRVIMSQNSLASTNIVQAGAMIDYDYRFAFAPGGDPAAVGQALKQRFPEASWRVRTSADVQPGLARVTDQFSTYLTLAGITALLIGGSGIGLVVQSYLALKARSIATLQCLGASERQIGLAYFLQIVAMGIFGTAGGLVLGALLPFGLTMLPRNLLPAEIVYGFYLGPLLMAGLAGLLTAIVFALWPLGRALRASPAELFRAGLSVENASPSPLIKTTLIVTLLMLAALAVASVARPLVGLVFVLVAGGSAFLLTLLALALIAALRRLARRAPLAGRLAIRTLVQPGGSAASVTVAIGAGIAILTTVLLVQKAIEADLAQAVPARAPTSVFIDIQPDQFDRFKQLVAAAPGARLIEAAPQLRARIVRLGQTPVDRANVAANVRWTLDRDRGVTFSAYPPDDTTLVAGSWWPPDYKGPPLVSMGADYAAGYGLKLGDTIGLNILGRVVEARIVNLRKDIDFTSGRLQFLFIMSPGLISAAPHTVVATVDAPPDIEPMLMARVADALPNVTPISVAAMVSQVRGMLDKLGIAVIVTAGVTIASGLLVLAGSIGATRQRQRYQTALLKIIGATRGEILQIVTIEYLVLGTSAAIVGGLLGTAAAWLLISLVLKIGWSFTPLAVLFVAALAIFLIIAIGLISTVRLLAASSAKTLRTS